MILLSVVLGNVWAARPLGESAAESPTCFPISTSVRILDMQQRIGDRPVFVEELSACTGIPVAPHGAVVPVELTGRNALQSVVDQVAASVAHVARYEVLERAGGWYIAPVGVPRMLDVRVSVDGTAESTWHDARIKLYQQVQRQRNLSVGPYFEFHRWGDFLFQPTTIAFSDEPFLEALHAMWAPHSQTPAGFVVQITNAGAQPELAQRGLVGRAVIQRLLQSPPDDDDYTMPVATPETAWTTPPESQSSTGTR